MVLLLPLASLARPLVIPLLILPARSCSLIFTERMKMQGARREKCARSLEKRRNDKKKGKDLLVSLGKKRDVRRSKATLNEEFERKATRSEVRLREYPHVYLR